jgi:hypothetical protein
MNSTPLAENMSQLQASGYKFTVTDFDALGSAQYTLATIVQDVSGSVAPYAKQLETAVKTIFKACEKSPLNNALMLRLTTFNDSLAEVHGFKLLSAIKESDYDSVIQCGGSTALFESVDEAVTATSTYGRQLTDKDFLVNAIIVIVTDGQNNAGSIANPERIKKAVENAKQAENLESLTLILVGVTSDDNALDAYLQDFKDKAGITQYVSIGRATPGKIAKLADFVSQSISSTSSSLGTGAPSQPITSFKF